MYRQGARMWLCLFLPVQIQFPVPSLCFWTQECLQLKWSQKKQDDESLPSVSYFSHREEPNESTLKEGAAAFTEGLYKSVTNKCNPAYAYV